MSLIDLTELGDFELDDEKLDGRKFNKGRPKGQPNKKNYFWEVDVFDKTTNQVRTGKFSTITELNKEFGLKLNADYVKRIMTHYRADETMRNKENSFLARYGHIKIRKIKEPRTV